MIFQDIFSLRSLAVRTPALKQRHEIKMFLPQKKTLCKPGMSSDN
jgi:hypothetical protein